MLIGVYIVVFLIKFGFLLGYLGYVVVLIIGGFVVGIIGFIIGIFVLRFIGDYFVIIILVFGEIIRVLIEYFKFIGGV